MVCKECTEWFEVWTNVGSLGWKYCPLCGHEFSDTELEDMILEDNEDDEDGEE